MTMKSLSIATVCLAAVMLMAPAFTNARDEEDTHEYTIGVKGTPGAKMRMFLVAKPSANRAPTLEEKIVTVPFETEFKASTFYVWFHTLGDDEMIGSRIRSIYKIDRELQGSGFGFTIKKGNRTKTGFGNL